MRGSLGEVAQDVGALRCLLCGDDASLVLHCQLSIQPFEDIHHRSGVARPIHARQKLQSTPAVLHRVVPANPAPVLQAESCVEAHPPVQVPICGLCVLRRHTKALIEAGEEVIEHAVSVVDGGCVCESQLPLLVSTTSLIERSTCARHFCCFTPDRA